MSVETEVVNKITAVYGQSRISPPELYATVFAAGRFRPDVVLDLPSETPVVIEIKYVSRPTPSRHISEVLRRINQAASVINMRGALVVVTSNDFTPEDIEEWRRQIEEKIRNFFAILRPVYISRYSDFLAEPAQDFVNRVIPSTHIEPVND